MAKHTLGPLRVAETVTTRNHPKRFWNTYIVVDANGEWVATAVGATEEESKANAQRFAAVDDLLDAARMMLKCIIDLAPYPPEVTEGVVAIADIGHAAIAKVEKP